jgi:DNA-binding MarR family transcriptional regulator
VSDDLDTEWLEGLLGYQLRRASYTMADDYNWFAGPDRLRQTQTMMLGLIADNPGAHSSTIGNQLRIARANMVQLVGELVERGLVERRNSPTDRRVVELYLTDAGAKAAATGKQFMAEHEERMLAVFGERQREQLHSWLGRLADHDTVSDAPRLQPSKGLGPR